MGWMAEIETRFKPILDDFVTSRPVAAVIDGTLTKAQYSAMMRQVFHHTRENPQLQALATVYFRGRQRDMVKPFFQHATSEIGHDQLALDDFKAMGGDAAVVPYENPLPATSALLAYGFFQIYNQDPVGYLGYLYFLEFTPTSIGGAMLTRLKELGIPDEAMVFLQDHTTIDEGHNRLMHHYVKTLITSEAKMDAMLYAARTTGYLYTEMLSQAMAAAETDGAMEAAMGWNWEELQADGLTPADVTGMAGQAAAE